MEKTWRKRHFTGEKEKKNIRYSQSGVSCLLRHQIAISALCSTPSFSISVGMQACGDVMIGQHGCTGDQCMKLSLIFVGQSRFPLLFFYHHHLEIISQSIKPTVERLSYILHDSSISRGPHLLTISSSPICPTRYVLYNSATAHDNTTFCFF